METYSATAINSNQLVLHNDGNVGIGTTSPTGKLDVANSTVTVDRAGFMKQTGVRTAHSYGLVLDNLSTTSTENQLKYGALIESTGAWTATGAINYGLRVNATGGTTNHSAIFEGGNVGVGQPDPSAQLEVLTTNITSTPMLMLNCTEENLDAGGIFMKIIASGDANIHDNSAVTRLITFYDGGGEIGYITSASDGVVNAFASDVRLKKDIEDSDIEGLSIINAVKIRDFTWNEKVGEAREGVKVKTAYVADELYEVYPSATIGTPGAMKTEITPAVKRVEAVEAKDAVLDGDGNVLEKAVVAVEAVEAVAEKTEEVIDAMSVVESRFISVLIKAVQELSAKVTALENA